MIKMILVKNCDDCPYNGECKAWNKLSKEQMVSLMLIPTYKDFILKGCPLENYDGEKDE